VFLLALPPTHRYQCLPDVFSRSDFTATMTQLSRFNIPRMPGCVSHHMNTLVDCLHV
jgi:hypothetical protein